MKIIISRIDAIGDVVLTLPLAGAIKKLNKNIKILFLGRNYTKSIVKCSEFVDEFIDIDEFKNLTKAKIIEKIKDLNVDAILHIFPNKQIAKIAYSAKIPLRIGTKNRYFHWFLCNKLLNISRKNSDLHEAQLNLLFTQFLEKEKIYELEEIPKFYGFHIPKSFENLKSNNLFSLINKNKFNLILHPKSKGSAREWGFVNFNELISLLPTKKFNIFITGLENEKEEIEKNIDFKKLQNYGVNIHNLIGKTNNDELVYFISQCDGLVSSSTGTLHIAAMSGIYAIGLYAPIRPIFPKRWKPIGNRAYYFVKENNENCIKCTKHNICECIQDITPTEIANFLIKINDKQS